MKENRIAVTMPARGRADYAKWVWDNVLETAEKKERIALYIFIDSDDPDYEKYLAHFDKQEPKIRVFANDRSDPYYEHIATRINYAAWKAIDDGFDIMITFSDDNEVVGAGWDIEIDEVFSQYPDKLLCATWNAPNREMVKEKAVVACTSKEMIQVLGYLMPPQFIHFYTDWYFYTVCKNCNRFWMSEKNFVKDLNPKHGKKITDRKIDDTHKRHRTKAIIAHDKRLWDSRFEGIRQDTQKLQEAIAKFARDNCP